MRVLLFSDLHGESGRLKDLWTLTDPWKPNRRLFLGDIGAGGILPVGILQSMMEKEVIGILGNNDHEFASPTRFTPPDVVDYFRGFREYHRFTVSGHHLMAVHGAPHAPDVYLYPHTPSHMMQEWIGHSGCPFLVCGHNHRPFARRINQKWLLSPGSVGHGHNGWETAAMLSDEPPPEGTIPTWEDTSEDRIWELPECQSGIRLEQDLWFRIIVVTHQDRN